MKILTLSLLLLFNTNLIAQNEIKIKEGEEILALEMGNGIFSSFLSDGCDALLRMHPHFIKYKSPIKIKKAYTSDIYCIASKYYTTGIFLEKNQIKYKDDIELDSKYLLTNFGNVIIIYNPLYSQLSDANPSGCKSDGLFFYAVFKMRFKYVDYQEDIVIVPNFFAKSLNDEKSLHLEAKIKIITDITYIEPYYLSKEEKFIVVKP